MRRGMGYGLDIGKAIGKDESCWEWNGGLSEVAVVHNRRWRFHWVIFQEFETSYLLRNAHISVSSCEAPKGRRYSLTLYLAMQWKS
jgi:hypothetical protein